nr:PREDICTED: sushi domain-containing protein 5 [Lepisosteus oculatus]
MALDCCRTVILLQFLGFFLSFKDVSVQADGRVFIVESKSGSEGLDAEAAQRACDSEGGRLASVEDLRQAVAECSFTACTRGWLAGPTIGTTVCNSLGSGQQSMTAVVVKTENASTASAQLDTFCIKDKGKPCGDPPSFPHTSLQGHTGFEMGDELLYVCAQSYVMASGRSAFSLLCDSCGEWYGLVQACVKDETEAHIDYEDKFPDGRHLSYEDPEEPEDSQEALSFGEHEDTEQERGDARGREGEQGAGRTEGEGEEEVEDSTDRDFQEPTTPTESPVSLLSQKHLFWFPSETFHEPEEPGEKEVTAREGGGPVFTDGDNHIGVKTSGSATEGLPGFDDGEDFPIDLPAGDPKNDTKQATKDSVASTDESWLDGYPVTQEVAEDGEKVGGGSTEAEDGEVPGATDRPNHVEISRADAASTAPSPGFTQIAAAPTGQIHYGVQRLPAALTPSPAPETAGTGEEEVAPRFTTTPSEAAHADTIAPSESASEDHELAVTPTVASWETTEALYPIVDHMPEPTDSDDNTTPYQIPRETTAGSSDDFAGTGLYEEPITWNLTHAHGPGAKLRPTAAPCVGEDCPQHSSGPMIAVIIVAICLLVVVATLAVWCYKKRQQKSSVYKMNGKGQTRHPQQIEMQQKV